jgi:hypothetical protein
MPPTPKAAVEVEKQEEQASELAGGRRNRIVGLEYHDAAELIEHPKNWRLHPETQRNALKAALDSIGIADAVLAYKPEGDETLMVIDGHLRRDLMVDDQVPVLVLDLSDNEADLLLASHDVITTMAGRDENMLASLLDDIEGGIPRDLMIAIDPDLEGKGEDALAELVGEGETSADATHPILPLYDEGYDSVILFATSEADFAWLEKELKLPTLRDRTRIGMSHVLTVEQFRTLWNANKPTKKAEPKEVKPDEGDAG